MKTAILGILLALVGSPARAASCLEIEPQIQQIMKAFDRHALAAAEAALAPLEAAHAECAALVLARARIKAGQGDAREAQALFFHYSDLAPEKSDGNAYFARFLLEQGEYERADTLSSIAINQEPDNPTALAVRGQLLALKGQSEQGLALLIKTCQLNPEDADAQFQLGVIYNHAKRPQAATQHFEKAVEIDANNASAWDYLALNLERIGQIDQAESAYKRGLAVNHEGPKFDAFLDYNYGRFLRKRNQLAESKKHLDIAVSVAAQVRAPWYERAKLNLQLGNLSQARSDAETAASITQETGGIIDLQIYDLLEVVYRRLGEAALANKYAELSRGTPPPVRQDY